MSKIRFDTNNPNVMSEKKHQAFDEVITKYGFAKDPWLNDNGDGTYLVIDGEQGIKRLQAHNVKKFPAKIFKVPYTEVRILRQIANKLHGIHNQKKDADEFRAIFEDGKLPDFAEFLGEPLENFQKELEKAFDDISFDNDTEEEIPEPPKKPRSKLGDIYELDNHRIMCGDCTNTEQKEKLLSKITPDILATDPPYCSGGFQESGKSVGSIGTTAKPVAIKGDNLSTRGYVSLIKNMLLGLEVNTAYIFTDWRMWTWLCDAVESSGYPVKNMLVWEKDYAGMGFPWRTQHELILYSKQTAAKMRKGNSYGNVLECKRTGNHNHPTEKPVELIEMLLDNSEGDTVFDPFLGSGTTLIACENQKKTCYGIEMDPRFVDVIIQRWENRTGKKAKKI